MQLTTVLLLGLCLQATATGLSQTITFSGKEVPLEKVFLTIKEQTGYFVSYKASQVRKANPVTIQGEDMPLEMFLNQVLKEQPLDFSIEENTVFIKWKKEISPPVLIQPLLAIPPPSADITISGIVTNSQKEPLERVSVVIKGTQKGTVTDAGGRFQLSVPTASNVELIFSFVGHQSKTVKVGNQTFFNIALELNDHQANDAIVITALGIKREQKSLGYSVTKVDGDAFQKNKTTSIASSLVGKVAGVNAVGTANGPGSSTRVTIRGNTSIAGDNQPLYVVDGIPIDNTLFKTSGGASLIHDWGDNISSISSDDIEDLTVLKGATAAALYGSRAKNGAILITTKSGRGQKGIGVEVNSNTTFSVPYFIYDLQKEYGPGFGGVRPVNQADAARRSQNHWGEKYDGKMTIQYDGVERPYSYVKDQVLKDFYSTGLTTTNNIAVSNGGEKGYFRLGYTFLRDNAIINTSHIQNNQLTLSANQKLTDRLTIGTNIRYTKEKSKNRLGTWGNRGNTPSNIVWISTNMPTESLSPGYDENLNEFPTTGTDLNATNPYFVRNKMKFDSDEDRLIASANARYEITDWLFVQGRAGQDFFRYGNIGVVPDGTGYFPAGSIDQTNIDFWERNFEGQIGINKNVGKNFTLSAIGGGNIMTQTRDIRSINATGFVIPHLNVVNNTSSRLVTVNTLQQRINSLFATTELGYKDYLFLNLTGRNDWFSTLAPENNDFFYPSASASFVFSQALDLPSQIDFGKLRVSYASVGGATDPYMRDLTYGVQSYSYQNRSLGVINQDVVPNRNLRPLSVKEFEAGFNMKMFKNRLGIDFAFYNKNTFNDISTETITTVSGYSGRFLNVGRIRNRGIELLLTGQPIANGDFTWDVSANFAYNKSMVLKISNTSKELNLNGKIRHVEGMEYSQIVGRTILKDDKGQDVIDAAGLPVVPTVDVVFGTGIHPYTFGFTNTFRYKSVELFFLIDGKTGAKVYSEVDYNLDHRGETPRSLLGREDGIVLPGVTEDGQPNTVKISAERASSRDIVVRRRDALDDYIQDASFIKLRNVALTYSLPTQMLSKIGFVKGATVSFVAQNIGFFLKHTVSIDPESNITADNAQGIALSYLPPTRTYGFNVNFKF